MKVLRNTEWEPISWMTQFPGIDKPVYVFLNKRYGDVVALEVAKFIDVAADDVFIYNASKRSIISLGCNGTEERETSLPRYNVSAG